MSTDKICRVPRRYLHKVLQDLVKAGLVRSQSGPGGGYRLDCSAEEITILDVVNAVGPMGRICSCPLGLETHTSLCPLHQELDTAYEAMQDAFARVTVAQVLNQNPENPISPLREVESSSWNKWQIRSRRE